MTDEIDACINLERKSAQTYRALSRLFPEAEHLFKRLADIEESHAEMLNRNREKMPVFSPKNFTALPVLKESLKIAEHFRNMVESRNITLREASAMSIFFQESMGESYFNIVMSSETDCEIISKLMDLYFDEESHIELIQAFEQKGLNE
jgi:hypothetical protein